MGNDETPKGSLGEGVYFSREAYAGLGRRFFILAIDGLVIVVVAILLTIVLFLVWPESEVAHVYLPWGGFIYGYLVILEASPLGTLGFMLTGVKILSLKGERPSMLRMTLRLVMLVLGPFNPLIDLFWLGGDEFRQTLRDKFAGTVVVRREAQPAGRAPIHVRYYSILGFMFAFAEVQKPRSR